MRRLSTVLLAVILLGLVVGGAPAKDSRRVVTRHYGCQLKPSSIVCQDIFVLKTSAYETFVTAIRLTDQAGGLVPAIAGQDLDGDGTLDRERRFCGYTENFRIKGGVPVEVRVSDLRLPPDDCGTSTRGELRVGFK